MFLMQSNVTCGHIRYFAQLYTKQLSISDVVALLQRLKASSIKHENDVFACMIRNLFDEYRFFQQ